MLISANTIRRLISLDTKHLEAIAWNSGYHDGCFSSADFLGMTNGGEFCYKVEFVEGNERNQGKVFVKYDPAQDRVSLDY